jgi:hypothetical protein
MCGFFKCRPFSCALHTSTAPPSFALCLKILKYNFIINDLMEISNVARTGMAIATLVASQD